MDKNELKKIKLIDKCYFLTGVDNWNTKELKDIKLGSILMTDGPNGIRKELTNSGIGLNESAKATCMPCNVLLGSTWDKEIAYKFGQIIAEEAKNYNVSMVLGPGINIKRSPLCGRNFEYLSEDPFISGIIGSEYIKGVQDQNIGCSLKHFASNNQETYRASITENIDERALREIYLKGFEIAVKESQPMSIMTSYNRINGVFSSDNKRLLTDIARNEWGFKGIFVSDWCGTNDRVAAVRAGLDLEMPYGGKANPEKLYNAVKNKKLDEQDLDNCVSRLVDTIRFGLDHVDKKYKCDFAEHHKIAREIVSDGIVLLKNQDKVLPLNKDEKVLYVGDFLTFDKYQGGGSSHVNANNVVSIKEALKEYKNSDFARGYDINSNKVYKNLFSEVITKAKVAEKVVLFLGLSDLEESEGYDRKNLNIKNVQNKLVKEIFKVNKNIVVVLINGSPIEMPFFDNVKGIVEAYFGGEAYAQGIVDILFNKVNPSGRLAETFPLKLKDTPCYKFFPGGSNSCDYRESIFVGYRYYVTKEIPVQFPFGFGLSYSNFEYKNLNIYMNKESIVLSFKIKNNGPYDGKEVAQVYVGGPSNRVFKPGRELKAFDKVFIKNGEEKLLHFEIPLDDLRYYNASLKKWVLDSGIYTIYIGGNSFKANLLSEISIKSKENVSSPYDVETYETYLNYNIKKVSRGEFSDLYGGKLPKYNMNHFFKFDLNSSLRVCRFTPIGCIVYNIVKHNKNLKKNKIILESILSMPFRQIFLFAKDLLDEDDKKAMLAIINGRLSIKNIKTIKKVMSKLD